MDYERNIVELYENAYQEGQENQNNRSVKRKNGKSSRAGKVCALTNRGIAFLAAGVILFSGLCGFGGAALGKYVLPDKTVLGGGLRTASRDGGSASNMSYDIATVTGEKLSVQEVAAMNANAVVEIRTEQVATDSWMQQYVTKGAGSGVIISENGYIVTNNHVISGANKITVKLKSGDEYEASLIGKDNDTDVAVIKIEAEGLTSAVYGDSSTLVVGDIAVAIGNPLGELGGTATFGRISATDRNISIDGKAMTLIQTDASINPGNSGGGLFNEYGELIGIVIAKSTGSDVEGLGFAIPIDTVKTVAQQLVDYGYIKGRPALGVTLLDLTSARSAIFYGVRNTGLYIESVESTQAQKAGLQKGDMLYYIGDIRITDADELQRAVNSYKVGDKAKVTVVRGDEIVELTVEISEKK
ncbi:MAG: trypsin-like serine protease [Firmicutes bacterium]|nr:trypsin-like serine protease [Bacillota bacterium]